MPIGAPSDPGTDREKFVRTAPVGGCVKRDARTTALLDMEVPVDVLRNEHGCTRRMIGVLLAVADRVEAGQRFPADDVAVVLSFFREFVECVHHAKESVVFYPFAAMAGGDAAAESVGELVADHFESKMLLHSLTVFWEPDGLRGEERKAFSELARAYGSRLRRHMDFEERVLFPVATDIPGDDRIRFLEEFETIAASQKPLEFWIGEIDRLESTYLD